MIDTVGRGIKKIYTKQRNRFFPMPDYDIDNEHRTVGITIYGKKVASILATFFSIYFVFRTNFLAFIFSPATESSIFPGLSPDLNITRAEPWKRLR